MEKETTYFAKTNFRGSERIFGINQRDRRQHTYVIGKTGAGKSVLLKNMAIQDIRNGHGVAIVDPHGEFVEEVLASVPPERADDVIYFNPADQDYAIGFNILEVGDPRYKHLVASGLMGIFTKIWANTWSARMEYILNNCVLALLDTPGSSLLGIPRLLVDQAYRERVIANVKDPVVRSFWIHEYAGWQDRFRSEAIAPIQNKVGQFLSTPLIRNVVGQSKSTVSIDSVMNDKKILLVNVSKGRIGEDNSALLGAMIITKLQLAAMERVRIPEEQRQDFHLYVDEFQNFATDSFAGILSEARKYRLNLIIAHQYIGQLVTEMNTKVRDAVFGNCGTLIVFRIGAADGEFLEQEFAPEFTIEDLVNLPNYHICLKLLVNGVASRPFSATTLPPIKLEFKEEVRDRIIEYSRTNYARPSKQVEEEITKQSSGEANLPSSSGGGDRRPSYSNTGSRPNFSGEPHRDYNRAAGMPVTDNPRQRDQMRFSGHLGKLNIEFDEAVESRQPVQARPAPAMQHQPHQGVPHRNIAPHHQYQSTSHQGAPSQPRSPAPHHPSPPPSERTVRHGQASERPASPPRAKEFSLSDVLKSRAPKDEHQKKHIDLPALRQTLSETLKNVNFEHEHEKEKEENDELAESLFPTNESTAPTPPTVKKDEEDYSYDDEDRRR